MPTAKPRTRVAPRRLVIQAAMFDNLSRSMEKAWKMVSKDGKLTAENIKDPIKEIRRALLEADVSLPVVRRFVKRVEEKALGREVVVGVQPEQQFIKVVYEELVELMGSRGAKDLEPGFPQVILMAGLQGVGKTTACGKLALYLKQSKKRVMMIAADVYRPAAIDQLMKLGSSIDVPVFQLGTQTNPVDIVRQGIAEAKKQGMDAIIVDTAGRLQVDEAMMGELKAMKDALRPSDTLLVVDAMTGQEAAALVKAFNEAVGITGSILTKMDGDSRGGAALSVREVSGAPIKFVGVGEKMEALEPFYPERMATRILGQGDIISLVEKAEQVIKAEDAEATMKRMMESKFDFNDFLAQMKTMSNMGGLQMMKLMPGFNKISEKQLYEAEKQLKLFEDMVNAMDEEERSNPDLLTKSAGRRRRVAEASGKTEAQVLELLGKFAVMREKAQTMGRMMKLGGANPAEQERLMREMVEGAKKKVDPGKVRRKKDKAQLAAAKSKGFGSVAANKSS